MTTESIRADGLAENTVHHSLLRAPRFLGVDWTFLVLEGALMGGILFVVGFTLAGFLLALVGALVVHIPARRLLAHDPHMLALVRASLRYGAYYAPASRITVAMPPPRPSIPARW